MEGQEELQVISDHQQLQTQMIIKGKRTKRQRPMSPFGLAVTSSSSSAHGGEEHGNSFTSASYESTEEEEDMANCLILLAQGCDVVPKQQISTGAIHEASVVSGHVGKGGFYVYECKTCNRTFPSFQALGGHRASHKKPKSAAAAMADHHEKKPSPTYFISASSMDQEVEDCKLFVKKSSPPPPPSLPTLPIPIKAFQSNNNSKTKIHECSICGSEFTSGQALGGHMRRHRAVANNSSTATSATQVVSTIGAAIDNSMRSKQQQERSLLALDLNLPAPEDHDHHHHHHLQQHQIHHQRDSKFQFVPTQQTSLVFNAPALVDCHY